MKDSTQAPVPVKAPAPRAPKMKHLKAGSELLEMIAAATAWEEKGELEARNTAARGIYRRFRNGVVVHPKKGSPFIVKVEFDFNSKNYATLVLDTLEHWLTHVTKEGWYDAEKEQCVVLILNTRYAIKGHSLVSLGSLNEAVVHPREVFRPAVVMGAYCIVLMHNHPSGEPAPSQADHSLTRKLRESGEIIGIKLLDHVIVGGREGARYFSFKEAGVL